MHLAPPFRPVRKARRRFLRREAAKKDDCRGWMQRLGLKTITRRARSSQQSVGCVTGLAQKTQAGCSSVFSPLTRRFAEVDSTPIPPSMTPVMDSRNWFDDVPTERRRRLLRSRRDGGRIEVDGARLLNFAANDYLGLSHHPEVCRTAVQSIEADGFGSGASRLVSGDAPLLHELEARLAAWKGCEEALLVGSGMLANIGLLDALADRHTHLFCDRLNHASLVDGARLSRGKVHRYSHLDMAGLTALLRRNDDRRRILVSDGVFSMDGDCVDLGVLLDLADAHDALLVLDDAHGLGVLGANGGGLSEESGVQGDARLVEVGTFGKALGGYGAFILGTHEMIEGLRQRLRTMIFSTAVPACAAAAMLAALTVLQQGDVIGRLRENIDLFVERAKVLGLPLMPSRTAIQPLVLGSDEAALDVSGRLRAEGFFVPAIRPPTVPEGTARLRITLSAVHGADDIEALLSALGRMTG